MWILGQSGVLLTSGKLCKAACQAAFACKRIGSLFWSLITIRNFCGVLQLYCACIPRFSSSGNQGVDEGLRRAGMCVDLVCATDRFDVQNMAGRQTYTEELEFPVPVL